MLVVWDLKWSCWQFSLIVGHSWAGEFLVRAPTLGSKAQSAAICRSSPLPTENMLNKATRTVNSVPWQRVRAADTCRGNEESEIFFTCLPVCRVSDWTYISSLCLCNTCTQMQTHIIRIHGEHPRLQWVTPGYTNSPSPLSLSLLPSSHTSGIWNLLAAESHRAIKPSKAHKHTRVERQTMLARQAANRHNASWTWTNPSDRFLSCPSLRPSLWTIPLSFSQTPPGSESRENFYIFTPTWKCYLCREG